MRAGPTGAGVAIELGTSVPLATERPELGSGKPSPYALLAVELLPLEAVWIDLNLGVQFSPVRGRARSFREAPFASVAVGLEFRERLWPYVELGWFATPGDGAGDLLLGDAGLIWQASERLFVDVAVYFPLGREAPDLGITIGFVLLFEPLGVEERS
ncbi:MAG: hypothetical protein KatS3mg102_2923 [Planctomycetota bacterium]|nr:MAG: hypothetical protein KatS3mg102_2923 [Planctomycetota bacterium]